MSCDSSIHAIDTGLQRARFDAAYLIVEKGRGALVDCGTSLAVAPILSALEAAGLGADEVDWLILTHVHLDHAGGAGQLLRLLPSARLYVHPRGAQHMIDPSRLIAGATKVYGEDELARSYGEIVPVAQDRVVVAQDGEVLSLAGRALLCIDTPGHARHHQCILDAQSRCWFTGDAFGTSYRELDNSAGQALVIPSSSPVQFDPDAMHDSIARMMAYRPEAMYLTHYGRVEEVERLARSLHEQIDATVALARGYSGTVDRHRYLLDGLRELYLAHARRHGSLLDDVGVERVLGIDIELNAQGLGCWLDRAR